ncbi:MAG: Amidohydrolase [Mucilaginibacter sp.]|jgi:L-fuconolactonase|nr:Amidohydrolase [Mucilaginibacter sp.]MDB5017959.1 Amidohydrolase [Mucilaginibacter sp.]
MSIKIDAHQHFWKFDPVRDSWIDDAMAVIQKDFYPNDLKPILDKHGIDGCIAVQADQSEAETELLLSLADHNDFIKGVIGWTDLQANNVGERLAYHKDFKKLKGFRHVLQGEPDRAMMLNPKFMNGINALKRHDFTYDILIFPDQLGYTHQFVKAFPGQRFVINHIAKPDIKNKNIERWANGVRAIAKHENVWCKVSGMITEADRNNWVLADFEPYLDVVFEAFGSKRLMFGSDWPVCNVAGGYQQMLSVVKNYTSKLSGDEQARFWGLNAIEFYNLNVFSD